MVQPWSEPTFMSKTSIKSLTNTGHQSIQITDFINFYHSKFINNAVGICPLWQIEGEKVEAVTIFLFLALKSLWMVTAAMKLENDCFLVGKL